MLAEKIDKNLLPEDVVALQAMVRELQSKLNFSDLRCEKLEYKLRDLMRRVYGEKSEKLSPAQRLLFGVLEEQSIVASTQPALLRDVKKAASRRKGGGRHPKPENLPVRREIIDLPEDQKAGLVRIRDEITQQIEYRPSQFYLLELVRPVYAHPEKKHAPRIAALPPQVIPQAGVGPGFIAHVLTAKYVDFLPLHRQESIDARGGAWVSRQARCRYVDAAAHLLITIRSQMIEKILKSNYVHVDETFTKLLDPDRPGKAREAYLWGYRDPKEKVVVLEFSTSRSAQILHDFFPKDWAGIVQTDGAAMYPSAFKHRPNIVHVECHIHLRRYVLDAIKSDEHQAVPLMRDITALHRIEAQADALNLSCEQRGLYRHAKSKPILKRLQRKFRKLVHSAPPSGHLRDAVTYANNRWPHLVIYAKVGFGHVNIGNNPIERVFRSTKIGLKNHLFIGHPAAGWRSAVVYSVVLTCKILGVNPESYLMWVLPKLAAASTRSADGLLPHDYARLHHTESFTHCAPSPSS
jgi:transposase